MRIAVLGSGNGGCAVAFDCAAHRHSVSLFDFDTFPDNIKRIRQQGGIRAEGELEGFAPVAYAGHEIDKALTDAEIIYVVGPAYSTGPFAEACRPYLRRDQIVIVCPGSCMGSIEFKNGAKLGLRDQDIVVAETSTLPYAVRIVGPGRIRVFLKVGDGLFIAAVPSRNVPRVIEKIRDLYPARSDAIDAAAKSSLRPLAIASTSWLGCTGTTVPGGTSCHAEKNIVQLSPTSIGGITSAAEKLAESYSACPDCKR